MRPRRRSSLAVLGAAPRYEPSPDREPRAVLQAWLTGICRYVVQRHWEKRSLASYRLPALGILYEDSAPEALKLLEAKERLAEVQAALASLPERVQEAFWRHDVDGQTVAQVSEALATPPSTIYKHVQKARRRIAAALERLSARDRRHGRTAEPRTTIAREPARMTERLPKPKPPGTAEHRSQALRESLESAATSLESTARTLRVALDLLEAA